MATKFARATSKNPKFQHSTLMYDDEPHELLKEVAKLNEQHGLTMDDWEFTCHNYKGDKTGDFDWKNAQVTVSLGELFS